MPIEILAQVSSSPFYPTVLPQSEVSGTRSLVKPKLSIMASDEVHRIHWCRFALLLVDGTFFGSFAVQYALQTFLIQAFPL